MYKIRQYGRSGLSLRATRVILEEIDASGCIDGEGHAQTYIMDTVLRRRGFDDGKECGADANMAKLLASEATWHAAEATMQTYGGFAFAREYDIERKWREVRLYQTAPISTNLILAYLGQHVLGMPRSY